MNMEQKIFAKLDAYQEKMWEFIAKIVNIDSRYDSPEGIRKIANCVGDVLEPLGFTIEYHTSDGPLQLIAAKSRPDLPQVLIIGHMDTVFAKGTSAQRPFEKKEGKVFGPGVMDMKSGIGISVYTVKAMLECGFDNIGLTFLLSGDEEIGHSQSDAIDILKKYARGKKAVFNMEPGRENGAVVYGRKGMWTPVIEVNGIAAHSGNNPEKGASAILELARKTIDLCKLNNCEAGTTCNVGVFQGGSMANIVADKAIAKLDIRFKTLAEADRIKKEVQSICACNYDERTSTKLIDRGVIDYTPPYEITEKSMCLCKYLQNLYAALGYGQLDLQYVGGSSDASFTSTLAPTICGMGPAAVGAHTSNEYAFVDSCLPRCQLLAAAIMHIQELE